MEDLLLMLLLYVITLWLFFILKNDQLAKLKSKIKKLEQEKLEFIQKYTYCRELMYQYQRDNWQLHSALEFYKRPDIKGGIEINEDIKQAVKYCMIYSHPDKKNCKSNDEFIKFRELYNKLK